MRYPSFLKEGGSIGFIAPSFGCSQEPYYSAFENALKTFNDAGFKTVLGINCYKSDGVGISTYPEICAMEFNQAYSDPESDVLISCGGGELMCEILDYVDFDAIKTGKPKWFMGYSDNTNLTFLLETLCDTASIYGPCAPAFGMEPWHESIEDAYRLLRGERCELKGYTMYETDPEKGPDQPLLPYSCTMPRFLTAYDPASGSLFRQGDANAPQLRFSGRLIGGCMDILANLCGTKYDRTADFAEKYREDGLIWFLEACDLSVFGIRRAVWELQHAGWFRHVKGFLIGRPLAGREALMGLDHIHAVTDLLSEYGVPILLDVDIGHLPPMMPLVNGSIAEVNADLSSGSMKLSMTMR
jgi:muramoyltetrapeptide carboxypeptidase LdcA involved in peptidoglycan recycling